MPLQYRSTQVQKPSTKPTTDNSGNNYWVRHRRVNLDGQHTEWSNAVQTNLPATITPQSYFDNLEYKRDEILISPDDVVYHIVPRNSDAKGSITIDSFDSSWSTSDNEDTQSSTINSLDFGEFSPGNNPTKVFYVYNNGAPVENLTFNIVDNTDFSTATQYYDRVQIELDGTFSYKGSSPSTLYNKTIVWGNPADSFNTIPAQLPKRSFVKLRVTLIDFPSNGFQDPNLNLELRITTNNRSFKLPISHDWFPGSAKVDMIDFMPRIFSSDTFGILKVSPFLIEHKGRLIANYFTKELTLDRTNEGTWDIVVTPKGSILQYSTGSTIPDLFFKIGTVTTYDGTTDIDTTYHYPIKPDQWSKMENGSVSRGLFVKANGNTLEICESPNNVIGVSLGNNYYCNQGKAWVVLGETISAGTRVAPGANGKAYASPEGKFLLKESGEADDVRVLETMGLTSYVVQNEPDTNASIKFTDLGQELKPSIDLDFLKDGNLDGLTFTRASSATVVKPNGYIKTVGTDVPRIGYDPLTHECKGLLIEEGSTNELNHSEDFTNGYWTKDNITISTENIYNPSGVSTSQKLIEDTTTNLHRIFKGSIPVTASRFTASIFVKPAGRNSASIRIHDGTGTTYTYFDLASESIVTNTGNGMTTDDAGIIKFQNNWFRIHLSLTSSNSPSDILLSYTIGNDAGEVNYTGDGSSGVYFWGAQLEQKDFLTSYIPTTTSTATRSADIASVQGNDFSNSFYPDEFSIYYHLTDIFELESGNRFFVISNDGNDNKYVNLMLNAGSQLRNYKSVSGNKYFHDISLSESINTLRHVLRIKQDVSNIDFTVNDNSTYSSTHTFTNSGIPSLDRVYLGSNYEGTNAYINGYIGRFIIFPYKLSDNETSNILSGDIDLSLELLYPGEAYSNIALNNLATAPNTDVAQAALFFQDNDIKFREPDNGPIRTIPSPFTVLENTHTTASLADGASENFSFALGRTGTFVDITADAACWVVVYSDPTARSNDSSRSQSTAPENGSGVLAEIVFSSAGTYRFTPTTSFHNTENPITDNIYFKITNNSGASTTITLDLRTIKLF
jgi:hypothetical protein